MKKVISFLLVALCCLCVLSACNSGSTDNVSVTIGNSTKFTDNEIQQAVSKVKEKFKTISISR